MMARLRDWVGRLLHMSSSIFKRQPSSKRPRSANRLRVEGKNHQDTKTRSVSIPWCLCDLVVEVVGYFRGARVCDRSSVR